MIGLQTLRTQYRISDFINWQRSGSLELNPNFQRRSVWKKGAKSYLIDTILKGLPVPIIFLRDMPSDINTLTAKRDVVDGQQRIRTILSFVDKRLVKNFDPARDEFTINGAHNKRLKGKSFSQLSTEEQQTILDYQFSVHSFPADTDDRVILQIFARMNSTGYKLNSQELRNAEFYGQFKTLAYQLATEQLNRWQNWKIFSPDQIARMNEVELTSEFMLLISHGIMNKNNRDISLFYERLDEKFLDGPEVAKRLRTTFDAIETLLTKDTIAALFSTRTLFYALFAAMYGLQFGLLNPPPRPYRQLVLGGATLARGKALPIKAAMAEQLRRAATAIKSGDVPPDVVRASRGAISDASQRKLIIGHLAGRDADPCRQLN